MLTLENLKIAIENYKKELNGNHRLVVDNAVKKFFDRSNDEVVDFEVLDYVRNSKKVADEYHKIVVLSLILDRLSENGSDNFFEYQLEQKNYKNFRQFACELMG